MSSVNGMRSAKLNHGMFYVFFYLYLYEYFVLSSYDIFIHLMWVFRTMFSISERIAEFLCTKFGRVTGIFFESIASNSQSRLSLKYSQTLINFDELLECENDFLYTTFFAFSSYSCHSSSNSSAHNRFFYAFLRLRI